MRGVEPVPPFCPRARLGGRAPSLSRSRRSAPCAMVHMAPHRFTIASADGRPGWIYQPISDTLVAGVRALDPSRTWLVEQKLCSYECPTGTFDNVKLGDIFCWIGKAFLPGFERPEHCAARLVPCLDLPWRQMLQRGVYTIWFQTEPLRATCKGDCWGPLLSPVPAHPWFGQIAEVWDYSKQNIERIKFQYMRHNRTLHNLSMPTLRHVPPGHLRSLQREYDEAMHARHRRRARNESDDADEASLRWRREHLGDDNVSFVGALYETRKRCLERMARVRGREWIVPVRDAYTQAQFVHEVLLSTNLVFINLHSTCDVREKLAWEVQPCEAFRFAELLSVGAAVVSQHCGAIDEAEYEGLVQFAAYPDELEAVARRITREGSPLGSRAALEARFAERFDPGRLLQRAGVDALLASLQLARARDARDDYVAFGNSALHRDANLDANYNN